VADSNQTQSQLLSAALRRQARMKVACCPGELFDCLEALRFAPADIVLLGDSPVHHNHLVDTVRDLHASYPHVGLILLLDSYDRNLVVNAMREGARGLFCRSRQPFRALCRCISVVHQGQFWTNTEQIDYLIEPLNSVPQVRVTNAKGEGILTPREEQIAALVAEGVGNRDVARQLSIKENTVKKALLRVYDKLGVSNRVELVLYILTHCSVEKRSTLPAKTAAERVALDCVDRGQVNVLGMDGTCLPKAN
jgi:DNA-binding NarL/FixJ family response regulator